MEIVAETDTIEVDITSYISDNVNGNSAVAISGLRLNKFQEVVNGSMGMVNEGNGDRISMYRPRSRLRSPVLSRES